MYTSQLEERNKIAQEIYDNIGHTISASLMQLEAAKFVMEKDINKGREMIQNTIEVLRDGMESIRATLRNIKPPSEQIGINKLKLILNQYEMSNKIKANLYYHGELKEKRERTYQRICSTPVNSRIYVMGNIFVNFIIIIVQILLAIFAMKVILKINMYMPAYQLFLVLLLVGAVSIGIGMIVVVFSKLTAEAGNLSTLIITPTCMLGGCFWPIQFMPEKLQKISNFIPQKWAIEAIGKLQSGVGIKGVYMNIVIL